MGTDTVSSAVSSALSIATKLPSRSTRERTQGVPVARESLGELLVDQKVRRPACSDQTGNVGEQPRSQRIAPAPVVIGEPPFAG